MIEYIKDKDKTLAVILRSNYESKEIQFFTPDSFTQQLGYMNRVKDYIIHPHVHNPIKREIEYTKETLIIKKGRVRIDFYNEYQCYLQSKILSTGDIILLAFGGHGFKMLEDSEIFEVKQGPYVGEADKTRFSSITDEEVIILGSDLV